MEAEFLFHRRVTSIRGGTQEQGQHVREVQCIFVLSSIITEMGAGINSARKAGHWQLTPVIPATQEAEIRRIERGSKPTQGK
jgi:hypothetical protein